MAHSDLGRCLNDEHRLTCCRSTHDSPLRIAEMADFAPSRVDRAMQVEFGKQKHCPMPDEISCMHGHADEEQLLVKQSARDNDGSRRANINYGLTRVAVNQMSRRRKRLSEEGRLGIVRTRRIRSCIGSHQKHQVHSGQVAKIVDVIGRRQPFECHVDTLTRCIRLKYAHILMLIHQRHRICPSVSDRHRQESITMHSLPTYLAVFLLLRKT